MARGWESKAVEEQVAERDMPNDVKPMIDGARERNRQELELQRERVLSERTASPHRRAALEAALKDIEGRLEAL
jgi:hypothetical protein